MGISMKKGGQQHLGGMKGFGSKGQMKGSDAKSGGVKKRGRKAKGSRSQERDEKAKGSVFQNFNKGKKCQAKESGPAKSSAPSEAQESAPAPAVQKSTPAPAKAESSILEQIATLLQDLGVPKELIKELKSILAEKTGGG